LEEVLKRIAILAALSCMFAIPLAFGQSADEEPNEVCDAAKVGFYLPEDSQSTVDTGTWVAVANSEGLVVMVDKNDALYANKDLTDKNLAKACKVQNVKNYKFIDSYSDNGLVYVYGSGSYKDNSGKSYDGFFGILNNSDVKGTTFFFAFMVPSLKDKAVYKRIQDMVDSMVPMQ
jgi:hypothetical protein